MVYFCIIVFLILSLLVYCCFRSGIYNFLRLSKVSRTYIRKNRNGIKNYLFYCELDRNKPLGILYYLNIVFIFLLSIYFLFTILYVFRIFRFFAVIFTMILALYEIPIILWIARIDALCDYGKPFVLFQKASDSSNYYYSSLAYMLFAVVPVVLSILCIKEGLNL